MPNVLRYQAVAETFAEIPDEICLTISISGCKIRCPGCHSKFLWENKGDKLDIKELRRLVQEHEHVSCILLMGGEHHTSTIENLFIDLRLEFGNKYKLAWFRGDENLYAGRFCDYIKIGPYVEFLGPLTSKTTNQRLYRVVREGDRISFMDITNIYHEDS